MKKVTDTYACLYCGRFIEGEELEDGTVMFAHDDVPHPDDFDQSDEHGTVQ